MFPCQISQYEWEKNQRKYRELKKELEAKSTDYLEGMVDTYSRMKPFVFFKDSDRKTMGKLILTQRELSGLTREGLERESADVSPAREFLQFFADTFGFSKSYARREIAKDLLGRKGKPYFVVSK